MKRAPLPAGVRAFEGALRKLRTLNTTLGLRADGAVVLWVGDLPKNRAARARKAAQESLRERLLRDLAAWFDVEVAELHRIARPFRTTRARASTDAGPGRGTARPAPASVTLDEALALLGLAALPTQYADLQRAWSKVARRTHPDHGGSATAFIAARAAYEQVLARLRDAGRVP